MCARMWCVCVPEWCACVRVSEWYAYVCAHVAGARLDRIWWREKRMKEERQGRRPWSSGQVFLVANLFPGCEFISFPTTVLWGLSR